MDSRLGNCQICQQPLVAGQWRFCDQHHAAADRICRMRLAAEALRDCMARRMAPHRRIRFSIVSVIASVGLLIGWLVIRSSPNRVAEPQMLCMAPEGGTGFFPGGMADSNAEPGQADLASVIRGYYVTVPGGLPVVLESAKGASQRRPLPQFPPLRYDLLVKTVPVVVDPPEERKSGQGRFRTLGHYSAEDATVHVTATGSGPLDQTVREHELTHAWQYAACPAEEAGREQVHQWAGPFFRPLGDEAKHTAQLDRIYWKPLERDGEMVGFVRNYLARPIEIDPRIAAFKRWWAQDHGELLDTPERARRAIEHPIGKSVPANSDALQFLRLWDSYRDQPRVQELLLERMMQVL